MTVQYMSDLPVHNADPAANDYALPVRPVGGVGSGGGAPYTEDAAAAANPVGTAVMLVREDARAGSLTSDDGDNVAQRGNNKGEGYVKDTDAGAALGATTGAKVITDANGTIQQYLRGLVSQWIASTLTLASAAYDVAVSLTRTADTNAYAANDVVGAATGSTAALQFAAMGPSGKAVMITSAELEIDATAVISGETSYRLHLYNVTPPSALGDNTAWDLPSGDRASYLGYVDLGTPVDLGSTLYVGSDGINKQVKLSGTDLFGYLVTIGAYTPTSARVHKMTLHTVAL